METRVSEFVQLTGKMKNRKNWIFATLWLMEKVDVWWNGGSSSQFFLDDRAANRAGCASGESFPEGFTSAIGKRCSDLHRRR